MSYVSLYRKYRSQTFDDVVGQDHVTQTLQNAIKSGRIGHAYLFCGSRGTGKTTVARLLAKSVNCEHGPTPTPCGECDACTSVTDGSAVDVIELDAASHRGIADIQELRNNVKYPPMRLRYKVFVIDEAHQLSDAAKDAFLKTLEEPPAHAIFVLATTEAHEIPLTIRSRCQQFDFRRGSISAIGDRLRYVMEHEAREFDDDAIQILARCAQGSFRDSLSLLEQVMAYTDDKLTAEHVNTVLGMVDEDVLYEVSQVVADEDAGAAFELAGRLLHEGKDIRELLKAIAGHFRDLLAASVGAGAEVSVKAAERGRRFTRGKLVSLVEIFSAAEKDLRWNEQHRLALEMALLKAIAGPAAAPVQAVPVAAASPAARPAPPPQRQPQEPAGQPVKPPVRQTQAPASPVEAVQPPADEAPVVQGEVTLASVRRAWPKILSHIKSVQRSSSVSGLLREAEVTGFENGTVVIGFEEKWKFHVESLQRPADAGVVKTALEAIFGRKLGVKVVSISSAEPPAPTAEAAPPQEALPPQNANGDMVDDVLQMFGGKVIEDKAGDTEDQNHDS